MKTSLTQHRYTVWIAAFLVALYALFTTAQIHTLHNNNNNRHNQFLMMTNNNVNNFQPLSFTTLSHQPQLIFSTSAFPTLTSTVTTFQFANGISPTSISDRHVNGERSATMESYGDRRIDRLIGYRNERNLNPMGDVSRFNGRFTT